MHRIFVLSGNSSHERSKSDLDVTSLATPPVSQRQVMHVHDAYKVKYRSSKQQKQTVVPSPDPSFAAVPLNLGWNEIKKIYGDGMES